MRGRDLQRTTRERVLPDDKTRERVARYEATSSPTSRLIDPAISGVSFFRDSIYYRN